MSQACSLSLAACSLIKGRCYRRAGVILQLLQSTNICSFNQARIQRLAKVITCAIVQRGLCWIQRTKVKPTS